MTHIWKQLRVCLLCTCVVPNKANVVCQCEPVEQYWVFCSPFPSPDQSNLVLEMDNCNENEPEIR